MIKRISALIIFFAVFFFSGCMQFENKSIGSGSDRYNYLSDSQLIKSGAPSILREYAKGEYGYYSKVGKFLYFTDAETMESTALCNKPNCLHNNENCNAHIGVVYDIAYNDGYIYYNTTGTLEHDKIGTELYRVKWDGTEREHLRYFQYNVAEWCIHRGYMYYVCLLYGDSYYGGFSDSNNCDAYVYRLKLSDIDAEPEQVYFAEEIHKDASISSISAFGENLYFMIYGYSRSDSKELISDFIKVNLFTFEAKKMQADDGRRISYPMLLGDRLVFSYARNDKGEYEYYVTDFDGENPEWLITVSAFERVFCDGTYLYVDNAEAFGYTNPDRDNAEKVRRFKVYDAELNLIDEVSFESEDACTWDFRTIDDEIFFFSGANYNGDVVISYFDKSELGSINGVWKLKQKLIQVWDVVSENAPGALSDSAPHGSDTLVSLWQKAKDKEYGVKDSFQADGAEVEGGFSVRLIWEHEGGTFTAYFPFMEFENEDKAKEYINTNPYALQKENIVVNIGVESVPQEVYDMLYSILEGTPIEPKDQKDFSGENFVFE